MQHASLRANILVEKLYALAFFLLSIAVSLGSKTIFETFFSHGSTFLPDSISPLISVLSALVTVACCAKLFVQMPNRKSGLLKLVAISAPLVIAFILKSLSLDTLLDIKINLASNWEILAVTTPLLLWSLELIPDHLLEKVEKYLDKREKWLLVGMPALYAMLFAAISILLHFSFNTGAFDLGIYDRVVWLFSQGKTPFDVFIGVNHLGDHFEPILIPISWLYRLYDNVVVLLTFEAIIVAVGSVPLYLLARDFLKNKTSALLITLGYLSFVGIWQAIYFPVHPGTWIPTFYALALWAFHKKRFLLYYLNLLLAISCKESVPLEIIFLGIFIWWYWRSFKHGLATIALGLFTFVLIFYYIMPYFAAGAPYIHTLYSNISNSPTEFLRLVITHPLNTLRIFFGSFEKARNLWVTLGSTGFLALYSPAFPIIILPLIAERLLTNYQGMALINYHYLAPVSIYLFFSVAIAINKINSRFQAGSIATRLAIFVLVSSLLFTFASPRYGRPLFVFSLLKNFRLSERETEAYEIMKRIPKDASVLAQDPFTTHLAHRKKIGIVGGRNYQEFDYVLLAKNEQFVPYPVSQEEIHLIESTIRADQGYLVYSENNSLVLFKKR